MDAETFARWALDDARTLDERYTTELLIKFAETWWHHKHQTGERVSMEEREEMRRERYINPAYQPCYTEERARRAAEVLPDIKGWDLRTDFQNRPIRDIAVLRFLPALESLNISCDIADPSLLADLPSLRSLGFYSPVCEDFRPLARCTQLRFLSVTFGCHWPEVAGLEKLRQLESLTLCGNLLVLPPGLVYPRVRQGSIMCAPLYAKNVRDLPQCPACEFLTLSGVERLDGIEAFPRLRNLTLTGPVRDFAPLTALHELTWLHYGGVLPLDVAPLARLPRLRCAIFQTNAPYGDKSPPRDYGPLTNSPTLREFHVHGCTPIETEVAALNTMLPPWDELFLAREPRVVPPLRVIIAPQMQHPRRMEDHRGPDEPDLMDAGVRTCEGFWVARYATNFITARVGHSDWGRVDAGGPNRSFTVWVECYEVIERLAEIVDAAREVLARLRYEYIGGLLIALRVPPPKPTPAQAELLVRLRKEQDNACFGQRGKDEQERLERLHLYQLQQQEGDPIDPREFSASPLDPVPSTPREVECDDEDDDEDDEDAGDLAVKQRPDPPPSLWDEHEHPLADSYRLYAALTPGELWVDPGQAPLALHLLGRDSADEEIPEEEKKP